MSTIAIPNGGPSGIASMSPRAKPTEYAVRGPFNWGLSHQAFDRICDLIKNWGILGFIFCVLTATFCGVVATYSKTVVEGWREQMSANAKATEANAEVDRAMAATLTKFMSSFDQHANAMHEIQRQQSVMQKLLNEISESARSAKP